MQRGALRKHGAARELPSAPLALVTSGAERREQRLALHKPTSLLTEGAEGAAEWAGAAGAGGRSDPLEAAQERFRDRPQPEGAADDCAISADWPCW